MDYFAHQITSLKELFSKSPDVFPHVIASLSKRVESVDQKVNAYLAFAADRLPVRLDALPQGPLQGIPISLKDNICTHGWEVTCASNVLQGFIPPYDATVVKKLKDAGAFIFAKCDMDEFAFGSSSETSCYNGRNATKKRNHQGVKNPWDLTRIPGGSSGGSAACVAADEAICSLGSDTGGSIRQPAALCGVVGMKPTYGRVSRYGLVAFGSSLDQIGPFTKTVADNALLLQVVAGHDPMDSTSANVPVADYSKEIGKDVKGLRIGIPVEYFIDGIDPEVLASIQEAIAFYKDRGAIVEKISLPHTKYAVAVYYIIGTAEASSNLARFDGIRYGNRAEARTLDELYLKSRSQGFGSEAKRRILLGTFVLSSGYYEAYYKKAQQVRTLIKRDFEEAFRVCDVILTPTAPTPAFKIGEKLDDPLAMYLSDIFTISANLAGVPAMSVPCGFTKAGLPIGMQLIGDFFQEGMIYRAAHYFEQNTEHHKRKPNL